MTDSLGRAVWLSIGAHLGIAALIFLRAVLLPSEPVEVRDAIRVDVVGLPKKTTEAEAPAAPPEPRESELQTPPAPTPPAPPPPKASPPAAKLPPVAAVPSPATAKPPTRERARAQSDALLKLRALDKLEQFKKDVAGTAPAAPEPVRGNRLATGNALSGLERLDFDAYFGQIRARVFEHWSLPGWMADAEFRATVNVLIDERGYVVKKTVRRSSGNDIFDNRALEAIDAGSPFAPPPARLRGLLSTTGINFKFPQ